MTTVPDPRSPAQAWPESLEAAMGLAKEALPTRLPLIEAATKLIVTGQLELLANGTARLQHPDGAVPWMVDGQCPCNAPSQPCMHRIGLRILTRTQEALAEASQATPAPLPDAEEGTEAPEAPEGNAWAVPAAYLITIKGRQYVLYAGLRLLAGQHGLVRIDVQVISVSESLAVCSATARFEMAGSGRKLAMPPRRTVPNR